MIDNIQNKQESQLKTYISNNCDRYMVSELNDFLDKTVTTHNLDYEKFANELNTAINRTPQIRSAGAFIKKVASNIVASKSMELQKNEVKSLATTPLHIALNKSGFVGEDWELFLLDEIEEHCFKEFPIEIDDLIETNRMILDYCVYHDKKSYSQFIYYFLRSKVVAKCNVPVEMLEKKAKEECEKYKKIIWRIENE